MSYERTKYEALLDVDYAIELHNRHIKLYRHLRWLFSLVFLATGTAVFAGALADFKNAAKWIGGATVFAAILDHLMAPADKIAQHADLKRQWCNLRADWENFSLVEIDQCMSRLSAADVHIVSALEKPSFNANLRRHGREECVRKLSVGEWLVSAVA
ncbi:hypothetical protein [Pseudomonas kuykendallii]|uniref:hypothetical protein n=1 Tax=Pseudomonas kuykendallii TaxID=1007099 RepID=UPI0028D14EF0|nr:hypothetical protein [Pseudomonas kuykendallii]